tara:strand:- start:140 stop:424 length:285 start_codon:yes stop_codon:yes gene_type:complete
MNAYINLWVSVLSRNILDATFRTSPNFDISDHVLCAEAQAWINSKSFKYICMLINVEADIVVKIYEKIRKTKKKFSQSEAYEIVKKAIERHIGR